MAPVGVPSRGGPAPRGGRGGRGRGGPAGGRPVAGAPGFLILPPPPPPGSNPGPTRRARADFYRRKGDPDCLRCAKSAVGCVRPGGVACSYCQGQKDKCVPVGGPDPDRNSC